MKAFMTTLVAVLMVGSAGLATSSAMACHGGSGYGGYRSHYSPKRPAAHDSLGSCAAFLFVSPVGQGG